MEAENYFTFLSDVDKELQQHLNISKENLNATEEYQDIILNAVGDCCYGYGDMLEFNKFLELKKQNFLNDVRQTENQSTINSLVASITKKEKSLVNLELKFKKVTTTYEKLQAEKEKEVQENNEITKIYKTALKYYTSIYQYSISKGCKFGNTGNNYSVVVDFFSNGKKLEYPIEFCFDRKTDCLLDFEAGDLITKQQQQTLLSRFQATNNILALIFTLRNIVLSK